MTGPVWTQGGVFSRTTPILGPLLAGRTVLLGRAPCLHSALLSQHTALYCAAIAARPAQWFVVDTSIERRISTAVNPCFRQFDHYLFLG